MALPFMRKNVISRSQSELMHKIMDLKMDSYYDQDDTIDCGSKH